MSCSLIRYSQRLHPCGTGCLPIEPHFGGHLSKERIGSKPRAPAFTACWRRYTAKVPNCGSGRSTWRGGTRFGIPAPPDDWHQTGLLWRPPECLGRASVPCWEGSDVLFATSVASVMSFTTAASLNAVCNLHSAKESPHVDHAHHEQRVLLGNDAEQSACTVAPTFELFFLKLARRISQVQDNGSVASCCLVLLQFSHSAWHPLRSCQRTAHESPQLHMPVCAMVSNSPPDTNENDRFEANERCLAQCSTVTFSSLYKLCTEPFCR